MKTLFLLLALVSIPAQAATLQKNMKDLGGLFKQISASVGDRGQNNANADAAGNMVKLFTAVQSQVPDTIVNLPPAAKEKALAEYKKIIGLEIDDAKALQAALIANDNATAADVVARMTSNKKDGHNKFKKP